MAPTGYRSLSLTDDAVEALNRLHALVTGLAGRPMNRSEAVRIAEWVLSDLYENGDAQNLGRNIRRAGRNLNA